MALRARVVAKHVDPCGQGATRPLEEGQRRAGLVAPAACASRHDLGHGLSAHVYDCPACGARNAADISLDLARGLPYRHWQCHFCGQKVCLKDPVIHYADAMLSLPASVVPFLGPLNDLRRGLTERRRALVVKALLGAAGDILGAVASTPAQQALSSILEKCCDGTGAAFECGEAVAGRDSLGVAVAAAICALHLLGAGLEAKACAAAGAARGARQAAAAARAWAAGLAHRSARAGAAARAGGKPAKFATAAAHGSFRQRRQLARQAVARLVQAAAARAAEASHSAADVAKGASYRLANLRRGVLCLRWLCDCVDLGGTALQEVLQFFESAAVLGHRQEVSRIPDPWEQPARMPGCSLGRRGRRLRSDAGAQQQAEVLEMEKALRTLSRSCSLTGVRLEGFAEAAQELYRAAPTVVAQRSNL